MDESQISLRAAPHVGRDDNVVFELKTFYEGPGGPKSSRFLKTTTIIATNRTVEIEREGPNVFLTLITFGCWMMFSHASIEIYEVCLKERVNLALFKCMCLFVCFMSVGV
jgi:hypothetical protein